MLGGNLEPATYNLQPTTCYLQSIGFGLKPEIKRLQLSAHHLKALSRSLKLLTSTFAASYLLPLTFCLQPCAQSLWQHGWI